jgi:hypothetical protein
LGHKEHKGCTTNTKQSSEAVEAIWLGENRVVVIKKAWAIKDHLYRTDKSKAPSVWYLYDCDEFSY